MKATSKFAMSNVVGIRKAERGTHSDGKTRNFGKKVTLTFPNKTVKWRPYCPYDYEVSHHHHHHLELQPFV